MKMSKDEVQMLADNEKEWRSYILTSINKIQDDVTTIKLDLARREARSRIISSILGAICGLIVSIASTVLK